MQNIADNFLNTYSSRCCKDVEDKLDTFIDYIEWRRVTSSAKKKRKPADTSLHQTPDGSLLDIMRNAYDLLLQCDIDIPEIESNDTYVDSGSLFLIFLHPTLGPLWEVTRQKFSSGSISKGSELQVKLAEFLWRNVQIEGSMIIAAENIMGSTRVNDKGAEDGNHLFVVPDGYKLKITSRDPGLVVELDPIPTNLMDSGSWFWKYNINGIHIFLELVEL